MISLEYILKQVKAMSLGEITKYLREHSDLETIRALNKIKFIDLHSLTAILMYIEDKYSQYGKPSFAIIRDPETKETQFIAILIPECKWEEWKDIVKDVKGEMEETELKEETGKIAIVCMKGLQEKIG